jgi:hypothetical protein
MDEHIDIVHQFVDKPASLKVLDDLRKDILERNRGRELINNVSSLRVVEDGYIKKLGVSINVN